MKKLAIIITGIGVLGSLISIYVFFSGVPNIQELFKSSDNYAEELITVKDVENTDHTYGEEALKNMGLNVIITEEYDSNHKKGYISKQSIKAGSKVKPGTEIVLTMSLGKEVINESKPLTNDSTLNQDPINNEKAIVTNNPAPIQPEKETLKTDENIDGSKVEPEPIVEIAEPITLIEIEATSWQKRDTQYEVTIVLKYVSDKTPINNVDIELNASEGTFDSNTYSITNDTVTATYYTTLQSSEIEISSTITGTNESYSQSNGKSESMVLYLVLN